MTTTAPGPGSPDTPAEYADRSGPPSGGDPTDRAAHGAVDALEVAARLEAAGFSDRTAARRHGRPDVFSLAESVHRGDGWRHSPSPARTGSGLAESVRRALLLLVGVLLAAAVLVSLSLGERPVLVIGVAGWIGGQVVAAITWTRLGRGQAGTGLRRGGATSLLLVVAAAVIALVAVSGERDVTGMLLAAGWTAYACAVSLLVATARTATALLIGSGGLAGVVLVLLTGWGNGSAEVLVVAVTVCAVVAVAAREVRRAGGWQLPERADWSAAAPAAAQAALLATSLVLLLQTVPLLSATPLVLAGVVGAATADPAIALLRARLRTSATRLYAVSAATRHARRAAVLPAASTAAVSTVVAVLVLALDVGPGSWTVVVVPAAAFTALATTAAALTAFGAPWRAAIGAALAAGYGSAALLFGATVAGWVFLLALGVSMGMLVLRLSDPRVVV